MKTETNTRPEILSFEDFMIAFRYNLNLNFPELKKQYSFEEQMITKYDRELHGIVLRDSNNKIAPVFYYEDLYESYRKGASIQECIGQIVDYLHRHKLPDENVHRKLVNYGEAKKLLIVKLLNYRNNRKFLKVVPYKRFGDMAIVAQVYFSNENYGSGAVTVDKELAKVWDVGIEEIFEQAFRNMNGYELKINNLLDFANENAKEKYKAGPETYVLTYNTTFNGAVAILRTEELLKFAEEKQSDFFVLPVSIGEMLLIEYKDDISYDFLSDMLYMINKDHPDKSNVLSEQVFLLERNKRELTYLKDGQKMYIYS